jgi:nitrite reductase/ring-hydroxylating ferredoxin subunit
MGGPLRKGKFVGSRIDCPWHHYLFELSTGENFYPKSVYPDDLKSRVPSLRIFPIREVEGELEIAIA